MRVQRIFNNRAGFVFVEHWFWARTIQCFCDWKIVLNAQFFSFKNKSRGDFCESNATVLLQYA
jgi:hypothetical protein